MVTLKSICININADSAALMVPNLAERHNYCYDSYNMPSEWVAIKNSFDETTSGGNVEVYKTGKPAITNHLARKLEGHYIESVMILPVMRLGKTIAMLELVQSSDNKSYSRNDLLVAVELAKQLEADLPKQFSLPSLWG